MKVFKACYVMEPPNVFENYNAETRKSLNYYSLNAKGSYCLNYRIGVKISKIENTVGLFVFHNYGLTVNFVGKNTKIHNYSFVALECDTKDTPKSLYHAFALQSPRELEIMYKQITEGSPYEHLQKANPEYDDNIMITPLGTYVVDSLVPVRVHTIETYY